MAERWKKSLGALDRVDPDRSKLRTCVKAGHDILEPIPEGPRHRAGRIVSVALSITLIGLALAWSMGSLLGLRGGDEAPPVASPAEAADSNYVIDFLGFDTTHEASPGAIVARLRYSWASDTFPGIRDCELMALDADGGVVGRFTSQVAVLDPNHPREGGQEMRVKGDATTVRGACGPRLDDGSPYAYAFDQLSAGVSKDGGVTLATEARWLGDGLPGIVHCRFSLVGTNGHIIAMNDTLEPPIPGLLPYLSVEFKPEDIQGPLPKRERDVIPYVSCVPYVNADDVFPAFDPPIPPDAYSIDYTSPTGMGWIFSEVDVHPTADGWETDFRMVWENDVFPGERPCTVTLSGPSGDVIKTDRFQFESLQPLSDRVVDTVERPTGFDASCGERLDTPVAYVISEPTIVTTSDQVSIRYTVQWPDGLAQDAYPGTNQCLAALVSPENGALVVTPFTLSVPVGSYEQGLGNFDPSRAGGTTPIVRCEPFGDMVEMMNRFRDEFP